jgi:hypothetical protein
VQCFSKAVAITAKADPLTRDELTKQVRELQARLTKHEIDSFGSICRGSAGGTGSGACVVAGSWLRGGGAGGGAGRGVAALCVFLCPHQAH